MQSDLNSSKLYWGYWQTDSKVYMSAKEPRIANSTLKRKNKIGGLTLCNFDNYNKSYNCQGSTVLI